MVQQRHRRRSNLRRQVKHKQHRNKRFRLLWRLMISIMSIMLKKRNSRSLLLLGFTLRRIKFFHQKSNLLVQRVSSKRMMFLPSLKIKIFRKGKKDKRARRRLHKLLYQKQKLKKHLKSLFRENPVPMMEYLTRITSSNNHGMMLPFNLMIRRLEKPSNQQKKVKHTHT